MFWHFIREYIIYIDDKRTKEPHPGRRGSVKGCMKEMDRDVNLSHSRVVMAAGKLKHSVLIRLVLDS